MNMRLMLKTAVSFFVLVTPLFNQALWGAYEGDSVAEIAGNSCKIQHLGSKMTKEIGGAPAASHLKVGDKGRVIEKAGHQSLNRSQTYSPSSEFFKVGVNFDSDSVALSDRTTVTPPNPVGAIGPKQYIYALSQEIRSFDRKDGQLDGVLNAQLGYFFGVPAARDPQILYDPLAKAWYIVALSRNAGPLGQDILLAVCKDCVVTECSIWDFFRIPGALLDPDSQLPLLQFPMLAFDAHAVYINANVADPSASFYLGASIVVLQKESLLQGSPLVTIFPLVSVDPSDSSNVPIFLSPTINYDLNPQYGYFTQRALSFGTNIYTTLNVLRVVNPGSAQPTLAAPVSVAVPPYSTFSGYLTVPHPGDLFPLGINQLDPGGVPNSVSVIRCGQLHFASVNFTDASGGASLNPDRFGVLWYQIDVTGDSTGCGRGVETASTVPVAVQSGVIYDSAVTDPTNYLLAAISPNRLGDVVISGTQVGATTYSNVFYAARKKQDPLNTFRNPVLVTNNTGNAFNFGPPFGQFWGNYSSIVVDPCNDVNYWLTGMYAGVQNGWSVRTTELIRTNK